MHSQLVLQIYKTTVAFLFLPIFLSCSAAGAQADELIEWKVVNPFRFITDPDAVNQLRDAYSKLSGNLPEGKIYELERYLQDELAKDQPLGWFSNLSLVNHEKTCWDSLNLRFRNTGECEDYIHPTSHKINFRLKDAGSWAQKTCEWSIDNKVMDKQPCTKSVDLKVPYSEADKTPKKVTVRVPEDPSIVIPAQEIPIRDKLIVGLGDSFGSGEGNPDAPVTFERNLRDKDSKLFSSTGRATPRRDPVDKARWMDRRCHRSMYSYQFKTALQIALSDSDRHSAVTFVTFSCSGAKIDQLINKNQANLQLVEHARSDIESLKTDKAYRRVKPQIQVLAETLCPKGKTNCAPQEQRKIDYLLLSIGGNDIYFAPFVANIAIAGNSWLAPVAKATSSSRKTKKTTPDDIKKKLEVRYGKLNEELLKKLNIRDCENTLHCSRIVLNGYPAPIFDESKQPCTGERGEFKIPFGQDSEGARRNRIGLINQRVLGPLKKEQHDIGKGLGWTVVENQTDIFMTHGFCAQNKNSGSKTAEILVIPALVDGEWMYRASRNDQWLPFDISSYRSYEKRQRWFRLPVDAKLGIGQGFDLYGIKWDIFFSDERAGIIHPTAEGHAVMAGNNFNEIINIKSAAGK